MSEGSKTIYLGKEGLEKKTNGNGGASSSSGGGLNWSSNRGGKTTADQSKPRNKGKEAPSSSKVSTPVKQVKKK